MEDKFYVYAYLNPLKKIDKNIIGIEFDYEPFYIGKGCGNRCYQHLKESEETTDNKIKYYQIKKLLSQGLEPIIVRLIENLSEKAAYKLECELITTIGRVIDKTGPLTNVLVDSQPPSNYLKLKKKVVNTIIKLYNKGWYLKHIGLEVGVNELKVKSVLIENGIVLLKKSPSNKKLISEVKLKDIVHDYQSGLSIRKVSSKHGLSFEVIRKLLIDAKVIFRGYNYPRTEDHIKKIVATRKSSNLIGDKSKSFIKLPDKVILRIIELRSGEGFTIRNIAKILNLSYQKVYSTLAELNITTKRIK